MIDYTNRPGRTDDQARASIAALTAPAMGSVHQSRYSTFSIILPSGRVMIAVLPLAAAVAVEEAGYSCQLVGRLNEDNPITD